MHLLFVWVPEYLRIVEPEQPRSGVVFSFRERTIAAIGVVQWFCYDCPKPTEFGTIGANWEREGPGWRVDVHYTVPHNIVMPREHMRSPTRSGCRRGTPR